MWYYDFIYQSFCHIVGEDIINLVLNTVTMEPPLEMSIESLLP